MEQLFKFLNTLTQGEWFIVPVLLILFLILKRRRKITSDILITYNHLKLFLIAVYLIYLIVELINLYFLIRSNGDFISFKYRISGPYGWWFWFFPLGNLIIWIMLLFYRFRNAVWFSFIVFFFSTGGLWFERFVILITSLFRDYLPSSWSASYNIIDPLISSLLFLALLLLFHFFRKSTLSARKES